MVKRRLVARSVLGLIMAVLLALQTLVPARALAQPMRATSTEERFQDLFVTAGYATAFGAAIGTAFLAWTSDPAANLKYVAMGASLGFLGGSVLGSYVIFSPMLSDGTESTHGTLVADNAVPSHGIVLRPTWDRREGRLAGIEGGMTLLNF